MARKAKEVDTKQDLIDDLEQAFSSDNLSATHANSTQYRNIPHGTYHGIIPPLRKELVLR